jgi:hypothetical protein
MEASPEQLTGWKGTMSYSTQPPSVYAGTPNHIEAHEFHVVIVMSSPTGDSSDSHILTIPCVNAQQAHNLAQKWAQTWGICWYPRFKMNGAYKCYPDKHYMYPEFV